MDKIKLGIAPTRRSIFSAQDALKYQSIDLSKYGMSLEIMGIKEKK